MTVEVETKIRPETRPLRLSDAPSLEEVLRSATPRRIASGAEDLLTSGAVPLDWIRGRLEETRSSLGWFLAVEAGRECRLSGLVGLRRIDAGRSSAELLILLDLDETDVAEILDRVLKTAFYHFGLHRVELRRAASEGDPLPACLSGWTREGLLRGAQPFDGGFRDVQLLSILHEEFDGYGISFVPFSRGWVHVSGGRDYVDGVGFLRPERVIGPGPLLSAAVPQGICDRSGVLAQEISSGSRKGSPVRLPAEVDKAARQVLEYIEGVRHTFDFRFKATGSLFQQKVWAMLEEIPYGTTQTYEQVALRLTKNDPSTARRLTRAVGSACSANPLAIVVPCHRVIGKDNKLVGFSGGLDVKEWLLDHEMFGLQ